jgi:hypothetical protein
MASEYRYLFADLLPHQITGLLLKEVLLTLFFQYFNNGFSSSDGKSAALHVRPIRAF